MLEDFLDDVVELPTPLVFCKDPEFLLEDFDATRLLEDDLGPVSENTVDEEPNRDPLIP